MAVLCRLPAAQQLSSMVVAQLLQAALEGGSFEERGKVLAQLGKLPAAAHISSEALLQLVLAAVDKGCLRSIEVLCFVNGSAAH